MKDDYAKESSEFKVGKDVYVFKDGSQCLGTIESQEPVRGDAAKENRKKLRAIVKEAIAGIKTSLLKHFGGSESELSRYVEKIKIDKSVDVVVQMKCSSVKDGASV